MFLKRVAPQFAHLLDTLAPDNRKTLNTARCASALCNEAHTHRRGTPASRHKKHPRPLGTPGGAAGVVGVVGGARVSITFVVVHGHPGVGLTVSSDFFQSTLVAKFVESDGSLDSEHEEECFQRWHDNCPWLWRQATLSPAGAFTLQGAEKWSAHFRRAMAWERLAKNQPAVFAAPARLWNRANAGKRVRLVRDAAAPQGWLPINFLSARARTASVIYVEDDVFGWCCASEQSQDDSALLS